ncbi:MAG: transcriptional regulator [Saprospiraceae bacterium]|nr:transcriptional regulator [Saprospiraceae bacterium]
MDLHIGKQKFIESWGRLASGWGVPPAMAQLHALLLISPEPLTADDIRSELDISAGNASMTLRSLLEWGLIYREQRLNERKDAYSAEKDMWKVSRQIILNRKKRELEPMLQVLDELACVEENCENSRHFCSVVRDMRKFSHKANQALDTLVKAESGWLASLFMR